MKLIVLADIHGSLAGLPALAPRLSAADCLIIAGDITHFGGARKAARVIDSFRRFIDTIVAVHGNCDFPETGDWLRDQGLSARAPGVAIGGVRFRGVGGSLPCPGRTPSELSDTQLAGALADLDADASSGEPTAIIAHQPPYDTIADNAGPAGHVGSRALRACIERTRPLAVFCGHIHESFGVQTLGPTAVINPGSFRHGRYAAVEMSAAGVTRVDLLSVKVR
jgi:hypothetical protein